MFTHKSGFTMMALVVIGLLLAGCGGGGSPVISDFEVSGIVQDQNGQGMDNVGILVTGGHSITESTASDGSFVISGLTNTVRVYPVSEEFAFIPGYVEDIQADKEISFVALFLNALGSEVLLGEQPKVAFANGLVVDFSDGTIPQGASITVDEVDDPEHTAGMDLLGSAVTISLSGFNGSGENIQLGFSDQSIPTSENLGIFRYDPADESWTYYPVDYESGYFVTTVEHLSDWALAIVQQVSSVTAQLSSGSVDYGAEIVLSTDTSDARIYYTTDGSVPSLASQLYDEANPPQAFGSMDIQAKAVRGNMMDSDIASFSYTTSTPEVSLSGLPASLSLEEGASQQLSYTVDPADADIAFSSSNPSTATVDSEGIVSAMIAGQTVITVTATKAGHTEAEETVSVTVSEVEVSLVSLSGLPGTLHLDEGGTKQLSYTVDPADADVTFTSSDPAIAAVDSSGLVDALQEGSTTITVTATKAGYAPAEKNVEVTVNPTDGEFAGGSGAEGDPYRIATADQLNNIRNHRDMHFVLTENIDLQDASGLSAQSGTGWEPIGSSSNTAFGGSLDGAGYTIENLTIRQSGSSYVGLFGYTEVAELKNVSLTDVDVEGGNHTGGLVGRAIDTPMQNIRVTGVIDGGSETGGVVGSTFRSPVVSSSMIGSVSGSLHVGGLVGENAMSSSIISNSHADVTVVGVIAGGLVGRHRSGVVESSYATGTVLGEAALTGQNQAVGGLVGVSRSTIRDNSWADVFVEGEMHAGGLVGWNQKGEITNSHATGNVKGVIWLGGLVGRLGNGSDVDDWGIVENSYATGDVLGQSRLGGLVGWGDRGHINNSYANGTIELLEQNPSGSAPNSWIGGLVGSMRVGTIENSYATGNLVAYASLMGGLVGADTDNVTISGSWTEGNVEGEGSAIGGLVGSVSGLVIDSYAWGDVRGAATTGGLVGIIGGQGIVENSYAIGSVTGPGTSLGGLAGRNEGEIRNSYAIGSVAGDPLPLDAPSDLINHAIGGLVGENRRGTIIDGRAEGHVSGDYTRIGGLVGLNFGGTISSGFASGSVTGSNGDGNGHSVGGLVGHHWSSNSDALVENSIAEGDVTAIGYEDVGALIGLNEGIVQNSSGTGTVSQ